MKKENKTEQTVTRLREDAKNEFITYFKIEHFEKDGKKTEEYCAVIGHSMLYKGTTEEEVYNWVFDNPVKVAICFFMEYLKTEMEETKQIKKL